MNARQIAARMVLVLVVSSTMLLGGLSQMAATTPFDSPLPIPQEPEQAVAPIDLSVDADHDGMPDELLAALEEFDAAYRAALPPGGAARLVDNPVARQAIRAAEKRFAERMPYQLQTRMAQTRMAEIHQALAKNPVPESQAQLLAERENVLQQMLQDPNFALVDHLLSWRLEQALNAKLDTLEPFAAQPAAEGAVEPEAVQAAVVEPEAMLERSRTYLPMLLASESAQAGQEGEGFVAPAAIQGGSTAHVATVWGTSQRDPCSPSGADPLGSSGLDRTDILFMAGNNKFNNFFYAKKYSHIGVYNGTNAQGVRQVYEANPGDGVNLRTFSGNWQGVSGVCIARAYVDGPSMTARTNALNWAQAQFGTNSQTPYSFDFYNVDSTNAIYCSQLVRKIYLNSGYISIDLDSDATVYRDWFLNRYLAISMFEGGSAYLTDYIDRAVAPDEIALHSKIRFEGERQY